MLQDYFYVARKKHGLMLKKRRKAIKFTQPCQLKTYIDLKTKFRAFRADLNGDFEKYFFKLKVI